jgi:hypothetical protein
LVPWSLLAGRDFDSSRPPRRLLGGPRMRKGATTLSFRLSMPVEYSKPSLVFCNHVYFVIWIFFPEQGVHLGRDNITRRVGGFRWFSGMGHQMGHMNGPPPSRHLDSRDVDPTLCGGRRYGKTRPLRARCTMATWNHRPIDPAVASQHE